MDIADLHLNGFDEDAVDQFDDGCVHIGLQDVVILLLHQFYIVDGPGNQVPEITDLKSIFVEVINARFAVQGIAQYFFHIHVEDAGLSMDDAAFGVLTSDAQHLLDFFLSGNYQFNIVAGDKLQFIGGEDVGGVAGGHG